MFLTVFDKGLQMIGETKIEEYVKEPSNSHFAKYGAIWLHENVDDELAFIRIKILD